MANKKCLVFETLGKVSDLNLIKESADGFMRLHGVFGVCGVKNNNNRVYNKKNYGMMVEALQKEITEGSVLGELEHPNTMNITLENVSHKIESIEMNEDGTITGTIVLLNTPKGKIAQAIAEAAGSLYISSRGAGSIDESGNVTLTTIKTYDLVGTPGFSQAKLNLSKGQTLESLNESLEDGNIMYAIVESDDLLDTDDNKEDDKKSDDKPKDEPKDEPKEKPKDDKKSEGDEKKDDNKEDDNKNNDNNDVTMNELKDAIEKLSNKIESLQADLHVAQESLIEKENQITELQESIEAIVPVNYDAIEKWVTSEFANEFKESVMDEVANVVESSVYDATEAIAEGVQNWTVNEFAPVVEGWVTNEFAPVVEGWINNEFAPVMESKVLESQKAGRLDEIDALLESIGESTDIEKIVKEENELSKFKGIYVVEHMPSQYVPSWQMLNEERQNEIIRSSKMYDFTKEGVLESFWAGVDFNNHKEEKQEIVNVIESYHNNVAAQMKRFGKW